MRLAYSLLAGMVLVLADVAARGAVVEPNWLEPDFSRRAVFNLPENPGSCVVVSIPLDSDGSGFATSTNAAELRPAAETSCVARTADGAARPLRVVYSDPGNLSVLIGLGDNPRQGDLYMVYFHPRRSGAAPMPTPVASADGAVMDPFPISLEVYSHPGESSPTAWDKMLYLFRSASRTRKMERLASLAPVPVVEEVEDSDKKRRRKRERRIGVASTMLLAPVAGEYRFALNCRDAGFMLIDGELVVSWPGRHEASGWREGAGVYLRGGLHRMEIYNSAFMEMDVRPGWRVPTGTEIRPIEAEAMLSASEAVGLRVNELGRTLHPSFTFTIGPSYGFRESDAVFTPVTFSNTTQDWITRNMRCRWRFIDRRSSEGEGATITHRFSSVGQCKAVLMVRDELGFAGSEERTVDLRFVQPKQYAISADLTMLPAVCYPSDPVTPRIRVEGQAPPGETVELSGEVRRRNGEITHFAETLHPSLNTVFLPAVKDEAGRLAHLSWQLKHRGVLIRAGDVIFQQPPFNRLPAWVQGDRLYAVGGSQLVLVPYDTAGSFVQPRTPASRAPRSILVIDDGLFRPTPSGPATDAPVSDLVAGLATALASFAGVSKESGRSKPMVKVVSTPEWDQSAPHYGPLLKLVQVPAWVGSNADVVVFNIGAEDILAHRDAAGFERQVAALMDMVSVSMKVPVVWTTPPPFLPDRGLIRPFAVAVKRAADARRIPVADLYSAFVGDPEAARLFAVPGRLALSVRGQQLAAQIIARTIIGHREELD